MDSMRSLNTSLPYSSHQIPPEELLLAFKTAATSVTKLYKQTQLEVFKAQQAGYQDAIGDVLNFLDRRRLGLGDGEGWEVRKWAMERLDGSGVAGTNESEEEKDYVGKARKSSPTRSPVPPETAPAARRPSSASRSPDRPSSAPAPEPLGPHQNPVLSKPEMFTFQANLGYPEDYKMEIQTTVHPRATRQSPQPGSRNAARLRRTLGHGAGVKRKIPYGDFSDFAGVVDIKDVPMTPSKRQRGS